MKRKQWWALFLVLYIIFIFSNSMQMADVSSRQSGFVLSLVKDVMQMVGLDKIGITEHIIRKMAHFTEYAFLGVLIWQNARFQPEITRERFLWYMIPGFFVPFCDETIQLFVEGRSGQISDVWLDMAGVTFGLLICYLISKMQKKKAGKL